MKIGGLFEVASGRITATKRILSGLHQHRRWQIAWQIGLCSQTTSSSYERDWYRERCPSIRARGWTRGMKIVKSTRIFPYLRRNCEKRFAEHELPSIKSANNFRRRGILRRIVSFSFYAIEQINSRSIMMVFSV